ncbi:flavodoxin domain-containing protein [Nakamurella multipartita]|jgi:menaquinone-dependent protoporphyrinogen oxidase|uniref:Flavodoxin-like protein n=1 Tax=Nakamurella multipartita (strain ATCC 700099 / DSM 44233 / CIP 104796 / JCM 9543 / NBRC 105858 / Y-104) TaxID=479431 RepID=C8X6F4_NAKMY|nr:flavodoxin domain-containing protein [Nakamurella multipartita]ACV78809.1 Flavodoxin-like protein [Nakamurella multipartita DSM 44233]
MSKTLVAYASKMGGTEGIAQAVAEELRGAGLEVDLRPADDVSGFDAYDSVILGSAVYAGRWRRPARRLLKRLVAANSIEHPIRVWLFHSGPTGPEHADGVVPAPGDVAAAAIALGCAQPATFGGRIETATAKGFLAKSMAKGDLAGDFRDFDRIRTWADGIAAELSAPATPPSH